MSTSGAPSKVSFTVRRPTPVSRQGSSGPDTDGEGFKIPALPKRLMESGRSTPGSPLSNDRSSRPPSRIAEPDSSDEEEEGVDEIVTGFNQFGVQRLNGKKKVEGPLVIPALANRDWREIARKRKAAEMFAPASGAAKTGADGSVGGLGTKDTINSRPQAIGLVKMEKKTRVDIDGDTTTLFEEVTTTEAVNAREETEDDKAIRAILARVNGEHDADSELSIDAIPVNSNDWTRPADETDAYRKDVVTRPDPATLDDYERVPVEQFGAALLRGMGWKPGQAASRTRTGPVEPYLPAARPALLGIGAKEREVVDDGSKSKKSARPERRYIPVVKKEREGSGRDSGSAPSSRRTSRSPDPDRRRADKSDRDKDRTRDRRRNDDRDRDSEYDRRRDRDREYDYKWSDRERGRDYDYDRKDRRMDGEKDYEKDRNRRRDDDRRREKTRDDRDRDRY
ncbi:SPP2 [Sanghuangporus sanghuang]